MIYRAIFFPMFVFCIVISVFAEEPARVRWAIFADSPFGDLLFAELAGKPEIELVERERFEEIMAEQNLSALSNPDKIGNRLRLGKMLAADRLATLREIEEDGKKRPRLAVFDVSGGATVFDTVFFDKNTPESVAEAAAAIIGNLHRDYKHGVRAAVAVPDFLSTDTLSETKIYGQSFARLVAVSLLRRPGVAVVSLEELESLRRELQIGGREIRRTVPLLVRGEFKARKVDDGFMFDLSLKISDGNNNEETVSEKNLSEKDAAGFLSQNISNRIVRRLGDQTAAALTSEQQVSEFSKIATRFHEYGAYEQAVKYRQAVLLLDPKNAIERLRMLAEQYSLYGNGAPLELVYPHLKYLYTNRLISFEMGAEAYWGLANQTKYPENSRPTPHEVDCEMLPLLFRLPPAKSKEESGYRFLWHAPTNDPRYEPRWGDDAPFPPAVLRQLVRRNLLRGYANRAAAFPETILVDALPMLEHYPENGIPNLTEQERVNYRSPVLRDAIERDGAQTKRFITGLRDSKLENLVFLADFLELYLDAEVRDRWSAISPERLNDLKNRLGKLTHKEYSKHKNNEFFADYLYYNNFLDDVEEKRAEKLARSAGKTDLLGFGNPLDLPIEGSIELDAAFTLAEIPEWGKIVERHFDFPIAASRPNFRPTERIRYDVVLENHDDRTDVLWNPGAICTLYRDDGGITSRKIFSIPEGSRILSVKSDGKRLWVSTLDGIVGLDIHGGVEFRIGTAEGLPDFRSPKPPQGGYSWMRRHAMHLSANVMRDAMAIVGEHQFVLAIHPVDEGDVLVFGRFGERQQTSIARIRMKENSSSPSVKILLEANRVLPSESAYNNPEIQTADENKDLACTLSTVSRLDDRIVLGRYFGRRVEASPLLVDLETDTVTTLAEKYPSLKDLRSSIAMESAAGSLVSVDFRLIGTPEHSNFEKLIFSPYQIKNGTMSFTLGCLTVRQRVAENEWKRIDVSMKDLFKEKKFYNQGPILFRDGKTIHSIGEPWLKLDFSDDFYRLEETAVETIPAAFCGRHQDSSNGPILGDSTAVERIGRVSRSALFGTWVGVVAPGDVDYSIRPETAFFLDWSKPMKKTLPAEARHVSACRLEKHVAAAERIRSLGGFVGNNSQFEKAGFKTIFGQNLTRHANPERTVVVLPGAWKGNANDLKHLADLERFEELYIFDRSVSRAEAEALGEIETLRNLYFVRSSLDRDVVGFLPWNSIRQLCLYAAPGGPKFDVETQEEIFREARLNILVLVGPDFADRTAELLLEKQVYFLRLVGTNLSKEMRNRLKNRLSRTGASTVNFLDEQ